MKIVKSTTETYSIKGDRCLWAKINLDCVGETVNVMISSDYGEFNHYWGSCGCPPKKFLCDIDMHYGMGKLVGGTSKLYEADFSKRIMSFKKVIIEARQLNDITRGQARTAWMEMLHIFDYCQNSNDIYLDRTYNSEVFNDIFFDFYSIPQDDKIKKSIVDFWEDIWIPFTQFLKDEELND